MNDPLVIAYDVLVVLMGSSWGLFSIWTAQSVRPRWQRAFAVALPLCLFLRLPAYEPILFFSLQLAVVCGAIWISQFRRESTANHKFTLKELLGLTVIVAIMLAVFNKCEADTIWIWLALLSGGIAFGLTTLLAAWVAEHGTTRRWLLAILGVAMLAFPVSTWDAMSLNFPEWDRSAISISLFRAATTPFKFALAHYVAWLCMLALSLVVMTLALWAWRKATSEIARERSRGLLSSGLIALFLIAPIAYVFANLPRNENVVVSEDGPDGYPLLREATRLHVNDQVLGGNYVMTTDEELRDALQESETAILRVRQAIAMPFHIERHDLSLNEMMKDVSLMRSLARVFAGEGELAVREERYHDALQSALDTVQLGRRIHGSTLMMGLVAVAIESMGHDQLTRLRGQLDEQSTQHAIESLEAANEECPIEQVVANDLAWSEREFGWRVKLYRAFEQSARVDSLEDAYESYELASKRTSAYRRLLAMDFAITEFKRKNNQLPQSLDELPIRDSLKVDPFDGEPMRYRVEDDKFVLYSVGADLTDDGGEWKGNENWRDGDLVLNSWLEKLQAERESQKQRFAAMQQQPQQSQQEP